MTLGENGILSKAKLAVEKHKQAQENEKNEINKNYDEYFEIASNRDDEPENVDETTYTQLRNDLDDLKTKFQNLKTSLEIAEGKISSLENEDANYLTSDTEINIKRDPLYDIENTYIEYPTTSSFDTTGYNLTIPSITQYKYIEIQYDACMDNIPSGSFCESTKLIPVNQISYNNSNNLSWYDESTIILRCQFNVDFSELICGFKNDTTFRIYAGNSSTAGWPKMRIKRIYGIK